MGLIKEPKLSYKDDTDCCTNCIYSRMEKRLTINGNYKDVIYCSLDKNLDIQEHGLCDLFYHDNSQLYDDYIASQMEFRH